MPSLHLEHLHGACTFIRHRCRQLSVSEAFATQQWRSFKALVLHPICWEAHTVSYGEKVLCRAATPNKWLARFVTEARKEDGSPYPPKTIQAFLTGLLRHARASTGKEPPNFLQIDNLHFKSLYNAIDNVYRNLLGQGIDIQTNSAATLTKEELGTLWSKRNLGTHSPLSLLRSVFFVFGMHACLHRSKEH